MILERQYFSKLLLLQILQRIGLFNATFELISLFLYFQSLREQGFATNTLL